MDFNSLLTIGEIFKDKFKVEASDTADFHGNAGVRVLSTPSLLGYVERGSSTGVYERLPEGYSPVGTYVELHHVGATPIGGIVEIESKVSGIRGRKFTYDFKAFYHDRVIAYGVYEQTIIPLEDFLKKNNAI